MSSENERGPGNELGRPQKLYFKPWHNRNMFTIYYVNAKFHFDKKA